MTTRRTFFGAALAFLAAPLAILRPKPAQNLDMVWEWPKCQNFHGWTTSSDESRRLADYRRRADEIQRIMLASYDPPST